MGNAATERLDRGAWEDRDRLKKENDRLTARIEELRGELLERAEAHYGAVKAIQKQRVTSASLKHRIAALELELAATHERARALDRNLTIKSDELAAIKEESAETCRKLLDDNHRLEVQLAEAKKIIGWWESGRIHHCKDGMIGIVVDGHGHGPLAPAEAYARLAFIDAGKH